MMRIVVIVLVIFILGIPASALFLRGLFFFKKIVLKRKVASYRKNETPDEKAIMDITMAEFDVYMLKNPGLNKEDYDDALKVINDRVRAEYYAKK